MLAFQLDDNDRQSAPPDNVSRPAAGTAASPALNRAALSSAQPAPSVSAAKPVPAATKVAQAIDASKRDWSGLIQQLGLRGLTGQFAGHCAVQSWNDKQLILALDPQHQSLQGSSAESRLISALQDALKGLKIEIVVGDAALQTPQHMKQQKAQQKQDSAEDAINQNAYVQEMQDRFGAEVIPESVKPV